MQSLAQLGRASFHDNACRLQSGDFRVGIPFSSTDDGSCVTHSPPWRSTDTGDEADHWLVLDVLALQKLGSVLFSGATNFSNTYDPWETLVNL